MNLDLGVPRGFVLGLIFSCFIFMKLVRSLIARNNKAGTINLEGDVILIPYILMEFQTWIFMGVFFNDISQGMVISFPSIMQTALLASDSDVKVDLNTASWIASVVGIGAMIGFGTSSFLMGSYGRKLTYILYLNLGIVGWLCLYFGTNVPVLVIGRLLGGVSSSSTTSVGSVVLGEYTSPKHRGTFLNLKAATLCLGNLALHLIGQFLDWRTVTLIAIGSAAVALLIVLTWPESPSWFASVKRFKDCEKTFYWLRGRNADSEQELKEMVIAQKERLASQPSSESYFSKLASFLRKLTRRDFIKPVFIIMLGGVLIESSGGHFFPAYALQIIRDIAGDNVNTFYYTLGLDIIITFSIMFSSVLSRYFKRRTLLFVSGFTSLIVLFSISIYLFLSSIDIVSRERTLIPVLLLGLYLIINNLGCFSVASSLLGELFPLEHRGTGTCVSCLLVSLILMFTMKVTPYMLEGISVYGTFASFGGVMFLALIALWFVLPETKDKTLQEIENYFNHGKYNVVECDHIMGER